MKKVPKFKSLKEEREYWEARGPLAEGVTPEMVDWHFVDKALEEKYKCMSRGDLIMAVELLGKQLSREVKRHIGDIEILTKKGSM